MADHWQYEITSKRSMIVNDMLDSGGHPVMGDNGEQKKRKFFVKRTYLVLTSEHYNAVIQYNINRPSKTKKVHFFTNRETKEQFFPQAMVKHLWRLFGDKSLGIVMDAIARS